MRGAGRGRCDGIAGRHAGRSRPSARSRGGIGMKREILAISVSCVILAGAILVATFYCQRSHRFVHVSTDPKGFIMFDTKTKMSCWSGPRNLIDNFMKQ